MSDFSRQKLEALISAVGSSVYEDPRRCEAFLRDLYGDENRREIFLLTAAVQDGLVRVLSGSRKSKISAEPLLERLSQQFQNERGYSSDRARWAIETWAVVLGLFSEEECLTGRIGDLPFGPALSNSAEAMLRKLARQVLEDGLVSIDEAEALETLRQKLKIPRDVAALIFRQEQEAREHIPLTSAKAPQVHEPPETGTSMNLVNITSLKINQWIRSISPTGWAMTVVSVVITAGIVLSIEMTGHSPTIDSDPSIPATKPQVVADTSASAAAPVAEAVAPPVSSPIPPSATPPTPPQPSDIDNSDTHSRAPVAIPPPVADPSLRASFSCGQARAWDETILCSRNDLARADQQMGQFYGLLSTRLSGSARATLLDGQRRWLIERRQCKWASDPAACVLNTTTQRAVLLRDWLASVSRTQSTNANVGAPSIEAPVDPGPRRLIAPRWERRPDSKAVRRYYPTRALERGISGQVQLQCRVTYSRELSCDVSTESPEGYGFGSAALRTMGRARLSYFQDVGALRAGDWIIVPVTFQISNEDQ